MPGKPDAACKFHVGQVLHHRRYEYRGVVVDVDPVFAGSEEWYRHNRTQPEKNQPWYHVLVHGATHQTYVAETSLEPDTSGEPVQHPDVGSYFSEFKDGQYITASRTLH